MRCGLKSIVFFLLMLTLSTNLACVGKGINYSKFHLTQNSVKTNRSSTYYTPPKKEITYLKNRPLPDKKAIAVKGLYISTWALKSDKRMSQMIKLVEQTELNTMLIDVKDDNGRLTYRSNEPMIHQIGADRRPAVKDMDQLLKRLGKKNIYPIARLVTFKDPYLSAKRSQWAIKTKDGSVWRDKNGVSWVDPHSKKVWDYNLAIAKEAASLGFKEIQFDYVRFPENTTKYHNEVRFSDARSKQRVITDFLTYAKNQLKAYPVEISADVFGLTTSVHDDMGIGQNWNKIAPIVDSISPMMYPSHYAKGSYGLKNPDASPYETILHGLKDAKTKNKLLQVKGLKPARIRPWFQDFTASWVDGHIRYGTKQVKLQIDAAKSLGVKEYLLWNSQNHYHVPS